MIDNGAGERERERERETELKYSKIDRALSQTRSKRASVLAYCSCEMRACQVQQELPEALGLTSGQHLWEVRPLKITDQEVKVDKQEMRSYKPAWSKSECLQSLASTGMYEASGNACWLDVGLAAADPQCLHLPQPATSLEILSRISEAFFGRETAWKAQIKNASGQIVVTPRLIWPEVMEAFVMDAKDLQCEAFAGSLRLVGGHTLLHAWFLAVLAALKECNTEYLRLLWECALTTTIQAGHHFKYIHVFWGNEAHIMNFES